MRLLKYLVAFAALAFTGALAALPASAQATRTWVSGVGDDANPCSRTAPCKTFAGAISKTAAAGEINCIDPGGFGGVTITKSMAIICDGLEAGISASVITINAASTDNVILSGIDIRGMGLAATGINILSANMVTIRNVNVTGFTGNGISVTPSSVAIQVDLLNSLVGDNGGAGVSIKPSSSGSVRMAVNDTRIFHNTGDGFIANANTTSGNIKVSVQNSGADHNNLDGFTVFSNSGVAQIMLDSSSATNNNGRGLNASGTKGILRFTRSAVTANATGVNQDTGGQALSYGTNSVAGNGTDGTFGTLAQN